MTRQEIPLSELELAAKTALNTLLAALTKNEKELLLSGTPMWQHLPFEHIKELPAVKWKLLNISKMSEEKRIEATQALKQVLFEPKFKSELLRY